MPVVRASKYGISVKRFGSGSNMLCTCDFISLTFPIFPFPWVAFPPAPPFPGDGDAIQDYLLELTGERTVPRVFIKGQCIGGGSETRNLHQQNKLVPLLKDAGAIDI